MNQNAKSLLCLLSLYILLAVETLASHRKLDTTPSTTISSKTDFLDGLVDQILKQSRDVLVSETPRISRQVSSTSEASWNPTDQTNRDSAAMITDAQDLDDKHIHYDLIPGRDPTSEQTVLRLSQEPSNQQKSTDDAEKNEASNLNHIKKDTLQDSNTVVDEAGSRNQLARSINQHNSPLSMRAQQQLTRPPYAAGDQFQMSSPLLNIPFTNTNNKLDRLSNNDQSPELSSTGQNTGPILDLDRLYLSKDQLFSSLSSNSVNPSRAHNDKYTNEFQNIIIPEMQSVHHQVANQLQPKSQAESPNLNNFAASFVNITAPILKPLSASEAMKAEIAGSKKSSLIHHQYQQHTNSFMHHPPPQPSKNIQPTPQPETHYYMSPQYEQQQAIYSAPANQLLTHQQLESPIAHTVSSVFAGNDKDRMRLEPQHSASFPPSLLTGRWQYGGAHNMTGNVHQASGFRSPVGWHQSVSSDGYSAILNASPTTVAASIINASYPQTRTPPPGTQTIPPTIAPSGGSTTSVNNGTTTVTTNGFITSGTQQSQLNEPSESMQPNPNRRLYNLTRVEHISAECSNDLIRTLIVFNGTFKGIIYSSGYVRDPNCMYINGTGKTRYDFSIRLNQCGTLSRQEVHSPSGPSDISRQDKVMWNTLSIQYNPIIEQEWDEHFRVSCEYGSDFWKTVSFSPFNVETNTGSPVVFTVDPPQCQMEILRGYGVMGPRQEAVSGPVTVGDPLTLLIHMKSEKAGYDILVKNCIAHNGGTQKMQLIDSNGCVVNERFISPFRGNYNDNELKHVTLYSFLKAFRFTGSPVLYLECEIHMCQNKCPPQMCYWRRLSKRSVAGSNDTTHSLEAGNYNESIQAQHLGGRRSGRNLKVDAMARANKISDKVSLFQALEVRHDVPSRGADPNAAAFRSQTDINQLDLKENPLLCYRQVHLVAFFIGAGSVVLVAICVASYCWRASSSRMARDLVAHQLNRGGMFLGNELGSSINSSHHGSPDLRYLDSHRQEANLLNASYQKALDSMNPIRQHIATRHKERLLSAALQ